MTPFWADEKSINWENLVDEGFWVEDQLKVYLNGNLNSARRAHSRNTIAFCPFTTLHNKNFTFKRKILFSSSVSNIKKFFCLLNSFEGLTTQVTSMWEKNNPRKSQTQQDHHRKLQIVIDTQIWKKTWEEKEENFWQ